MTNNANVSRTGTLALRFLFMGAFVAASIGLLNGFLDSLYFPAVWAIVCMFVYAGITWWRFPNLVRTEDFADSFYYLGFLLTLVALTSVLVHLGNVAGDQLLQGVLQHFGIALATTVVGLLGRVLLVMFSRTPSDIETSARIRAEQAYDSLARSLDRMAAEAEVFSGSFATRLNTALGPIEPAVQRMVSSADRAAQGLEPLHERVIEFGKGLDLARAKTGESATALHDRIKDVGDQTAGELADTAKELKDLVRPIGAALRVLEQDVGATRGRLDQSTADFEQKLATTAASMSAAASALVVLTDRIRGLATDSGDAVRNLRADVEGLAQQIEGVAASLTGLGSAVAAQRDSIRGSAGEWEESTKSLQKVHAQLIQQLEVSNGAAASVRAEVAEGVRFLRLALVDPGEEPVEA
jgi:uncharacterized protein YoxC